jgi:phosphate transport system permease protein
MSASAAETGFRPDGDFRPRLGRRRTTGVIFQVLCLASISIAMVALTALLINVLIQGLGGLDWQFLTSYPSRKPERAGILSALVGTIYVMGLVAVISFPIGVGAAVYLEEYLPKNRISTFLDINIANLSGVPSIIYGLLGLGLFVRWLALGQSVLAGALTLSLLILPVIIVSSREAIKAVPPSLREASYAVGATRWQTTFRTVLPVALPGILTGNILAFSRAIGETAPLITIGALTFVAYTPQSVLDGFTVLPIQIFNWTSRPQEEFHDLAASAIVVLLAVLLLMNAAAVLLRNRLQKRSNW